MNWPCGRTPVEHDLLRIFERETEKLATTTGGEPVHDACGDRRGRIHSVDVSTAIKRMQESENSSDLHHRCAPENNPEQAQNTDRGELNAVRTGR